MSASILLQGRLEHAPETRTSKNGNAFTLATLRVQAGSELQFWKLFIFSESARAELARLGEGDAVAVQGAPKFELWQPENREARVNLSATVDHVLALKQPPKERKPRAADNPDKPAVSGDRSRGARRASAHRSPYAPHGAHPTDSALDDDIPF